MQKLIPYAQALKLQERSQALQVASMRMTDALDLLGLPVDRPVNLRIDAGPDADGLIAVEWRDDPPVPVPAEQGDDKE